MADDFACVQVGVSSIAYVDLTDYELVLEYRWFVYRSRQTVYARSSRHSALPATMMHSLIMSPPEGMVVDHIDGNGLNNRRSNLRIATVQENAFNRRLYSNNTTGIKGVQKHGNNRWRAQIRAQGKLHHLGIFDDIEAAAAAYAEASERLHGEFGCESRAHQMTSIGGVFR